MQNQFEQLFRYVEEVAKQAEKGAEVMAGMKEAMREAIESGNLLTEDEQKGARKTLTAAALTYVAATAVALAQLLRLLVIFGRRRDD